MNKGRGKFICLKIIVPVFFLCGSLQVFAQDEITLNYNDSKNKQTVNKRLFDIYNGEFLIQLPLTFHLSADNILFMVVGGDKGTNTNKTLWMFDKEFTLTDLMRRNKNLEIATSFKKERKQVEHVLQSSNNVTLMNDFPANAEQVCETPRIVFFKIRNIDIPVELKLKFYISETSARDNYNQSLTAEAGIIKIVIHIEK